MRKPEISAGIWYLGATADRFVRQGYRPDKSTEERFRLAGAIEGLRGLEMHYPTEVTDATAIKIAQLQRRMLGRS